MNRLAKTALIPALLAVASLSIATKASATVFTLGFPDIVIDYFDSGAGPIAGPYGGATSGLVGFAPVSTSVILGFNDVTFNGFVSLPTGSYITLGFTDEIITNGPGNDIFISEIGAVDEEADIFVSSDLINFRLLGVASNRPFPFNSLSRQNFDLGQIGFGPNEVLRAIRIVGRDNLGASPGFDLNAVQITFSSFVAGNPNASGAVPEPGTWAMMIAGFALTGSAMRRRTKRGAFEAIRQP
jgi:hypothetical protein